MRESDQPPDHIREYLDNTEFKVQDTPGEEEVVMTRSFGDEKYFPEFCFVTLRKPALTVI